MEKKIEDYEQRIQNLKIKLQAKNAEITIKDKNKAKVLNELHEKEEKLSKAMRKIKLQKQKEAEDLLSSVSLQIIDNTLGC